MRELTLELHNTENPISNTERLKINENWQRIISGYSYLQQQIKVLAGGAEVDELIQRLNEAVDGANVAVQQAIDANNTATQEAIEANNKALQDALTTVSQTLVDVNKAITNANTATTEANTAKQGALDATAQAQTALGAMQSLITNLGSKGVWNDTTQFYKNNLAVFNGSTFIALQDNLGKTPPTLPTQSNAYWSLFAEKGATGNTGLQGPPGKDGTGVTIIGSLPSETDLPPVGAPGDAYMIEGNLYVWQDNTKTWKNVGPIQGPEGKSAYDLAVKNGFQGTMEEWIESLKGEQGPPGPMGPPGPPADLTEINQQVSNLQTAVTEHVTGIATTEKLGHFKPDGETLIVDPVSGVASAKSGIGDVIEYNGDLNNLVKTGFYHYPAGTLNSPTAAGGFIQVIANEENVFQISQSLINGLSNYFYAKRVARKVNGSFVWGVDGYTELNGWAPPTRINDSLSSSTKYEGASANAVKQVNDKLRATWIADSTTNIPFGQDYSGAVRYRKALTTVECIMDVMVVVTTLTANVEYTIFTLASGYRPQEVVTSNVCLLISSTYSYVPIRINPNGQVSFRHGTTVPVGAVIKGQFTFATGEGLN